MCGLFDFIHKGDGIVGDAHVAAAVCHVHDQVVLSGAVFARARAFLKEVGKEMQEDDD